MLEVTDGSSLLDNGKSGPQNNKTATSSTAALVAAVAATPTAVGVVAGTVSRLITDSSGTEGPAPIPLITISTSEGEPVPPAPSAGRGAPVIPQESKESPTGTASSKAWYDCCLSSCFFSSKSNTGEPKDSYSKLPEDAKKPSASSTRR